MDNMNLPPKPPYQPDKAPAPKQERQIPLGIKLTAGAAGLLFLGSSGFFGAKKIDDMRRSHDVEVQPAATATQDPTESQSPKESQSPTGSHSSTRESTPDSSSSEPDALPTPETTITNSMSLEMNANYEDEPDPNELAKTYFDTRNRAIMLGCDQDLLDTHFNEPDAYDNAYDIIMSTSDERAEKIGDEMAGPMAKASNESIRTWVDARQRQNDNNCLTYVYAAEQGKTYQQTDLIDGDAEVIDTFQDEDGSRYIILEVPVHTQALIDGKAEFDNSTLGDDSTELWDYKYTTQVELLIRGSDTVGLTTEPGRLLVLSEFPVGERYDIVKDSLGAYADERDMY